MTDEFATGARALSKRFPVWFCDIWGVVHNGKRASRSACRALAAHRRQGGVVILITNAPRPASAVLPQLESLKVSPKCYDAIVTSGDVTRALIQPYAGGNVFHLGPQKDHALLKGLPVRFTGHEQADVVLCSGLYNDLEDELEDYDPLLASLRQRGLEMICANPDKVVQYGDRLIPCGGALAERYENAGGKVIMAGKPFAPIYDASRQKAAAALDRMPQNRELLALGDSLSTDITGARDYDIAAAFISGGIHDGQTAGNTPQQLAAIATAAVPGVRLAGAMRKLEW